MAAAVASRQRSGVATDVAAARAIAEASKSGGGAARGGGGMGLAGQGVVVDDAGWRDVAAQAPVRARGQLSAAPAYHVELQHVHGFRSHDVRGNLRLSHGGRYLYPAAGVGVVYDPASHTQLHYMGHALDD